MLKLRALLRLALLYTALFAPLWLFLAPKTQIGRCPGQYVSHANFNHDESQLVVVTMAQSPFG